MQASDAVGDERGYLVGLRPCTWDADSAPRFRRNHLMRLTAVYNASHERFGVMAEWTLDVAKADSL